MKATHTGTVHFLVGPRKGEVEVVKLQEGRTTWNAPKGTKYRKQDGTPIGARYNPPMKLLLETVTPLPEETVA